jgi:lysophospholipid acyltransferase (LPLAT)-like uncharacterized protein
MKLRHPGLIRLVGFVAAWIIKGLVTSLRLRVDFRATEGIPDPRRRRNRRICVFWHENMLVATRIGARTDVLVSQHADGELITQTIRHMGMGAARGSSRRGGSAALLKLVGSRAGRHMAVTPDGPRGPRRRLQPGVVYLSSRTGVPLVLLGVGYEKAWRARSWDRFAVPCPFSRATMITSTPIYVPPALEGAALESYCRLIEERLEWITEDAQRWATGQPRVPFRESWEPPLALSA